MPASKNLAAYDPQFGVLADHIPSLEQAISQRFPQAKDAERFRFQLDGYMGAMEARLSGHGATLSPDEHALLTQRLASLRSVEFRLQGDTVSLIPRHTLATHKALAELLSQMNNTCPEPDSPPTESEPHSVDDTLAALGYIAPKSEDDKSN